MSRTSKEVKQATRELVAVFEDAEHGGRNLLGVGLALMGGALMCGTTLLIFLSPKEFDKWMLVPVVLGGFFLGWGMHITSRRASKAGTEWGRMILRLLKFWKT